MSSVRSFVELFSLAPAPVAPTGAPPSLRLPVLVEALRSHVPRRQRLALLACEEALKTDNFFRAIDSEPHGLRVAPRLWSPSTPGEIIDAYRQIWILVREQVERLTGDERREAVRVLLRRARDVASIHPLSDLVLETLRDLSARPFVDRREVVECVEEIVRYQGKTLPTELLDRWRALRDELVGESFSTLLQRYVGLDLRDDKFDDEGNRTDKAQPFLEQLASQAVKQPELLDLELDWLLAGNAPGGVRFGYELGKRDPERRLMSYLLDRLRGLAPRGNGFLLSGYLRALAEADQEQWEDQLDLLVDDERLRALIPELTWRGQLTDRAAWRILALARSGAVPIEQFALFGMGGVIGSISEEPLHAWLDFLLRSGVQKAAESALRLLFYYYVYDRDETALPAELAWQVLTHETFFLDTDDARLDSMTRHTWQDTAVKFVESYPERGLPLVRFLLKRMEKKGGIDDGLSSPVFAVLNRVLESNGAGVWALVAPLLGPPVDERAYRLGTWLHGGHPSAREVAGALTRMPEADVWAWVEADIENRAWFIASLAPSGLFRDPGKTCWAREVLVRYGDRDDVRRNIGANFNMEVFWGSEADHLEEKKAALLQYRPSEDNPRVLRWIDDYVQHLEALIERAKTEEEREW